MDATTALWTIASWDENMMKINFQVIISYLFTLLNYAKSIDLNYVLLHCCAEPNGFALSNVTYEGEMNESRHYQNY